MNRKNRDISVLEYFNVLEREYLLYELRSKIFPSKKEKTRFKKILEYKRDKIQDIAKKNNLFNIFDGDEFREKRENEFLNSFGVPINMDKRDKYFYYYLKGEFSYDGYPVKLIKYDFDNDFAIISDDDGNNKREVNLHRLKRIL